MQHVRPRANTSKKMCCCYMPASQASSSPAPRHSSNAQIVYVAKLYGGVLLAFMWQSQMCQPKKV